MDENTDFSKLYDEVASSRTGNEASLATLPEIHEPSAEPEETATATTTTTTITTAATTRATTHPATSTPSPSCKQLTVFDTTTTTTSTSSSTSTSTSSSSSASGSGSVTIATRSLSSSPGPKPSCGSAGTAQESPQAPKLSTGSLQSFQSPKSSTIASPGTPSPKVSTTSVQSEDEVPKLPSSPVICPHGGARRKVSTVTAPKEGELKVPKAGGVKTTGEDDKETTTGEGKGKRSLIISNQQADQKWNKEMSKRKVTSVEAQEQIIHHFNKTVRDFETQMLANIRRDKPDDVGAARENVSGKGFTYLENLLRLMEQLSKLREENDALRRKCASLQTTNALTAQQLANMRRFNNNISPHRHKFLSTTSYMDASRKRCSSDESDEDSPTLDRKRPHVASKLKHRSQSVGSLDVEGLELESGLDKRGKNVDKQGKYDVRTDGSKVLHKVTSRLHRMKKVIKSKVETGESFSTVSAEQLVKANTKTSRQEPEAAVSSSTSKVMTSTITRSDGSTTGSMSTDTSASGSHQGLPGTGGAVGGALGGAVGGAVVPPSPSSVCSDPVAERSVVPSESGESFQSPTIRQADVFDFDPKVVIHPSSATPTDSEMLTAASQPHDLYHLSVDSAAGQQRRRRQSSPALSTGDGERTFVDADCPSPFKRGGSYKGSKRSLLMDADYEDLHANSRTEDGATSKSPWGRVKNIIHTRKDSLQKKPSSATDTPSTPESPVPVGVSPKISVADDDGLEVSRPTRSSTSSTSKEDSAGSPKGFMERQGSVIIGGTAGVDISSLLDNMSDEFSQKMMEWESKKRKASVREQESTSLKEQSKFSEDFIRKMEEWERIKADTYTSVEACAPGATQISEQAQKQLSESFSKTVQEWERVKTKRIKESSTSPGSSVSDRFDRKARKMERGKSRERDRSRNKYEKQIEKERSKLEKKAQKIEKERQKLERMKQQFDESGIESTVELSGSTFVVKADFAQKMREWERMKGLSTSKIKDFVSRQRQSVGNPPTGLVRGRDTGNTAASGRHLSTSVLENHHHRSHSAKESRTLERDLSLTESEESTKRAGRERSRSGSQGQVSGTATLTRSVSLPSLASDTATLTKVDDSTSIDLTITNSENSHEARQLRLKLAEKQEYIADLQDELQQLTDRITEMDREHNSHIAHYKRELWACSSLGHFTIESEVMTAQLQRIKQHVQQLERVQRGLITDKQALQYELQRAEQKVAVLESETAQKRTENTEFLESMEADEFNQLYNSFTTLNREVEDLRCNLLERDQLIESLRHHMSSRDLAMRLMYAQLLKQNVEMEYLRAKRKRKEIRRWRSFNGTDARYRQDAISSSPTTPSAPSTPPLASRQEEKSRAHLMKRLSRLQIPTCHVSGSAHEHHHVLQRLQHHHQTLKQQKSSQEQRTKESKSCQTVITIPKNMRTDSSLHSINKPAPLPEITIKDSPPIESPTIRSEPTTPGRNIVTVNIECSSSTEEVRKQQEQGPGTVESKLFFQPLKRLPKIMYDSQEEVGGGGTGKGEDAIAYKQLLPHSPVIRSKYVRKQRNQLASYPGGVEPKPAVPKRYIRNRKTEELSKMFLSQEEIRNKSRSDGSVATRPPRPHILPHDVLARKKRDSKCSSGEDWDVSHSGSMTPSGGNITPQCKGSPSINRPTRSPVRKLKTAAELLEESKQSSSSVDDRPRCHSLDVPRGASDKDSGCGASDKENSSCNRYSSVSDCDASSWAVLDSAVTPLQDVTNSDSTIPTSTQSTSHPGTHHDLTPGSSSVGVPRKARREFFAKNTTSSSSPGVDEGGGDTPASPRTQHRAIIWLARKHNTHPQPGGAGGSPSAIPSSPTSPGTIERRLYRLFGKHFHSPSQIRAHRRAAGNSGAINALCRQTLSVDLDSSSGGEDAWQSSPPSSPGAKSGEDSSPDVLASRSRTGRARFLDKGWLQKPKKFFKF